MAPKLSGVTMKRMANGWPESKAQICALSQNECADMLNVGRFGLTSSRKYQGYPARDGGYIGGKTKFKYVISL